MSEEEKKAIEYLKQERAYAHKFDNRKIITITTIALKLIRNQQKELDNLKEIEKSHKEENGKLRVELEKEKEKNKEIAIKNRALKEESNAYGEQIVSLDNQLKAKEQEKEYLKSQIPSDKIFYYSDKDYISKDKIKEIYNILGEYRHYTTPTIEQNEENENAVDKAVNFIKELLEESE